MHQITYAQLLGVPQGTAADIRPPPRPYWPKHHTGPSTIPAQASNKNAAGTESKPGPTQCAHSVCRLKPAIASLALAARLSP
jgi:hypothetical protein